MAWLSTWNNRIKLTVSATDIDSDLTWFPIIIHLKTANGDSDKVFQEVGASSQKIAVTQSDGTTQLYVELENWDADAHTAILHCGLTGDVISSSADTIYYLYYDSSEDDNTTYIGTAAGVTPVSDVWNASHKAVWHMNESPGTTTTSTTTTTTTTTAA